MALSAGSASSQTAAPANGPAYVRRNTFSLFGAYSGDSSHILMGVSQNRKLLEFGGAYGRKLYSNHIVNWQYNAEFLPVVQESDPTTIVTIYQTSPDVHTVTNPPTPQTAACKPGTENFDDTYIYNGVSTTYIGTIVTTCGRRWSGGEAISPIGFQWNFLPRHKLQPFFIAHGGYMYSTKPIPTPDAGSFNFTFDFGTGVELYRSATKSIRAEYRFHHISDANTTNPNPGIDNGLFQLTYSFGH